jgi:predicted RNase H-like HicB family nuclease
MRYPIAIEPATAATAWGVVVPDLPGCFSAGDTLEQAKLHAKEAVSAWLELAGDAGQGIPVSSNIDALQLAYPEFAGWLWTFAKDEDS